MIGDNFPEALRGGDDTQSDYPADEDFQQFLTLLQQLKVGGCNLLVVGDPARSVFTRCSEYLFGDDDALRQRIFAVTDAPPESIVDRLPDPTAAPRPISDTTTVLNHAGPPRSVTAATNLNTEPALTGVTEVQIADPQLQGLQSNLIETIETTAWENNPIRPSEIRVGLDSLTPLIDHYPISVVKQFLQTTSTTVTQHDAMAHYILMKPYDHNLVQELSSEFDAVIELRSVDPEPNGYEAEQRWHVPSTGLTMDWLPL
ncbi:hypothetical protein [Halorussus sp. MSC15.2]|uniref:DUF7504 family protein n=1 Tax=Halorussus sp. MSC15.2 TaxID=2283638 RepID=UPI0013D83088|nr:hypothetical protein [Halorussus sp. MSC15.2]NEU59143.1 hypothetical protein [Halorussus sp. MSC15.2]